MATSDHEQRITQLEQELGALQRKFARLDQVKPWWERIAGSFEQDPIYEEAMKLGRAYRESLRPQATSGTEE